MTDKDKKQDGGSGQIILESRTQTKKPSMYKVVMMNDDYTPMEFVVHVLQQFFGRTAEEATQIMLNVHQRGVGICGIYSFEIAETKASKTMEYARQKEHPLQLQLEKE
ncbi:MAG: ATP-dependent Clp protease adapter ClpS [Candidatus Puniceispirillum sp.]|jgi:ATP-dependent Clp protease adaptor protein ClpS